MALLAIIHFIYIHMTDQSIHGRMGLGTVCKAETSRMKIFFNRELCGENIMSLG
jgi:hypothetical protein